MYQYIPLLMTYEKLYIKNAKIVSQFALSKYCRVIVFPVYYSSMGFNKIICMSKAKQKEMEKLRLQKQQKEHQYKISLRKLIDSEQAIRICLDYSEDYFKGQITQSLEEYSPIHISRIIFDKQLEQIKQYLLALPDCSCKIEHFIVIMLKVLKLPFEKIPLYMVGLKDMFYEIVQEGKQTINYDNIFKYIVGQLIIMKQQEQNTEFHVQFEEKKKQDFLLHDNGIKRVFYSSDCRLVLSLDNRESSIKIYDQDMKNTHRFSPRKDMHNGKVPQIIDFDYSEMTMRLGIIFADKTIQSVHLPNFVSKTTNEFESTSLNQLMFSLPKMMKKIYYIQMLNKWLAFSDQINELYLLDMEKVRLKPEEVCEKIVIDTNQLVINAVLQIVSLSTICVVAGNQISFYNQNFTDCKITKFCHHQIISSLKYSQEKATFYLVGSYQKTITMFTVNRNKSSFKIWNFSINKVIVDFEIFPYFETLLICDQTHDLRLIHQPTKTVYKHQSYAHIVKMNEEQIHCYKLSKSEFMVYQTYMIALKQQKIAIQKQMEFTFLPYYYYDSKKEEFYLSVNDQILSFSILFGQIRKNFSLQTSNISKHLGFFLGSKTKPFVIDKGKHVFQLYMKSDSSEGENKQYKKKLLGNNPITFFYDQEMRNFMIVTDNCISQVRNDYNNTFNIINMINLVGFNKIISARFCSKTKYITILTANFSIYQFKNFQTHLAKSFSITFQRQKNDPLHGSIIDFHYCSDQQIIIILNDKNELYVVQRLTTTNYSMIDLTDYLPFKLKNVNFVKFQYSSFRQKARFQNYITLIDQNGFLLDINTEKHLSSKFGNSRKEEKIIKSFLKQSYDIKNENIQIQQISLGPKNKYKFNSSQVRLQRVHEKRVAILSKIKMQIMTTLTISKDGFIKLWNQNYECLFALKLPNLLKINWNMKEIHKIKNKKSIEEISQIILKHYTTKNDIVELSQVMLKTKKIKSNYEQPKKIKFEEDMPLQIQSKQVQDILLQEQHYSKQLMTSRTIKPKIKINPQLATIDVHPWRTKRQFVKIYERASPTHKYKKKIPNDLISLRTSLDMTARKKKQPDYKVAQLILPQLVNYQNQKISKEEITQTKNKEGEQVQNFQSCIYVKSDRKRRKRNQLDQIDRQFLQKQIQMQNRRLLNRYKQDRQSVTIDMSQSTTVTVEDTRFDIARDIQSVFEQHNKQCSDSKRGRIITIPKIRNIKEYQ